MHNLEPNLAPFSSQHFPLVDLPLPFVFGVLSVTLPLLWECSYPIQSEFGTQYSCNIKCLATIWAWHPPLFCHLLIFLIHPESNQGSVRSSIMGCSSLTVSLPSEGLVIFRCHIHSNNLQGIEVESWSWVSIRPRLYSMWKHCCHSLFAIAVITLIGRDHFADNFLSLPK